LAYPTLVTGLPPTSPFLTKVTSRNQSRIKGLGCPEQFSLEGPYDVFHDVIVYIICFRWFATFSFAFSGSRLYACRIYSIVRRLWLQAARNGVKN